MPESDNRPPFKSGDIIQYFRHEHYPVDSSMYICRTWTCHALRAQENLVIYEALYDLHDEDTLKVFARPINMFMSKEYKEKYPDIQQ